MDIVLAEAGASALGLAWSLGERWEVCWMRRAVLPYGFCAAAPVTAAMFTDYMAVVEKQMLFWAWL